MIGKVIGIFITPQKGGEMQAVQEVEAILGQGLKGDRYTTGEGSYNRDKIGKRQVTLINGIFFEGSRFTPADSRRNIVTTGVELMRLIGKKFEIGGALFGGLKYAHPCKRPSQLSGKEGFEEEFHDRGGLVAEILRGGIIRTGDPIIPLVD
jgi:hypothetical protein